ncbi:MAG: hypothetical protein M5U26_08310 [Planctomycetota bacterium]|nr:hypothetical protein [Planctomycetota bacterium]
MKTIVETTQRRKLNRTYPYLGIYRPTGEIVLFATPDAGIVLRAGDPKGIPEESHPAGYFGDCWLENRFDVFEGSITLCND